MNLEKRIKLLSSLVETIEETYNQGELEESIVPELEHPMRPRYLELVDMVAELKLIHEKILKLDGITLFGYQKKDGSTFIEISP